MKGVATVLFFVFLAGSASAQYSLYEKGLESYQKNDYAKSIVLFSDYLTRSIRDKKLDVDVHYYRGLAYYKMGTWKEAVSDFEETILLNHNNKGNIYWFMAKSKVNLQAYPEAINDYTKALNEITENVPRAKLYYERSQLYVKTGSPGLVFDDLNSGSILDPNNKEIKKELDLINSQSASSRNVAGAKDKDKKETTPQVKVPEVKQEVKPENNAPAGTSSLADNDKKTVTPDQKKEEKKKVSDPNAGKREVATTEKPAEVPPAVVTTPAAPPAPTLADLYKDERRYALVIGNSKYSKAVGVLKNPVNDATDIAKELRASNFDVTLLTDATYGQMRANMLKFKEKVDAGDRDKTVALFYYAGHGIQHEDENFLVPVDAALEYADDIARYCFPIQKMVLSNMERSNARMNIVILDACRNNPFPSLTRSAGAQGLGEMKRARGSFIAYATAPGSVAADGDGRNGLYTQELLKAMRKPGLTIEQVFKEVRLNVLRHSGDRQNTWDSSNIVGDFYFKF